jgi:hypothetical protein
MLLHYSLPNGISSIDADNAALIDKRPVDAMNGADDFGWIDYSDKVYHGEKG